MKLVTMMPVPMAMTVLLARMAMMLMPLPPRSLRRRSLFLLPPQLILLLLTPLLLLQLVPMLPPLLELLLGLLQGPLLMVWFILSPELHAEKEVVHNAVWNQSGASNVLSECEAGERMQDLLLTIVALDLLVPEEMTTTTARMVMQLALQAVTPRLEPVLSRLDPSPQMRQQKMRRTLACLVISGYLSFLDLLCASAAASGDYLVWETGTTPFLLLALISVTGAVLQLTDTSARLAQGCIVVRVHFKYLWQITTG